MFRLDARGPAMANDDGSHEGGADSGALEQSGERPVSRPRGVREEARRGSVDQSSADQSGADQSGEHPAGQGRRVVDGRDGGRADAEDGGDGAESGAEQADRKGLSRAQLIGCVVVLLLIFFFASGKPVWEDPFHIDRQVWLSYFAAPPLVVGLLLYSKRFTWLIALLSTIEVVILKFGISYALATVFWLTTDKLPTYERETPFEHHADAPASVVEDPAPAPTPWSDDKRSTIRGLVQDVDGKPVGNALVFVSGGLDELAFEAPSGAARIEVSASGFVPPLLVARKHQRLEARSSDGQLHTLVGSTLEDHVRFNRPLLASGSWQRIVGAPTGQLLQLQCNAHNYQEGVGHLVVLHHPFHARSDAEGRFSLERVPSLALQLSAHHRDHAAIEALTLSAGEATETKLTLRPLDQSASAPSKKPYRPQLRRNWD
jgi:hypothetical protein